MRRSLPPLNSLRVFEETAKHSSLSTAAKKLFVTKAAVSKQIRILESHLEARLFDQKNDGINLTEEGRQYYEEIFEAFENIESATQKLTTKNKALQVTLDLSPSLSMLWLTNHFNGIRESCSPLNLNVLSSDAAIDWLRSDVDIAIRCTHDKNVNLNVSELLVREKLMLISSNRSSAADQTINSVSDLLGKKLISVFNRKNLWLDLFNKYGLDTVVYSNIVRFEHFYMVLESVKEGIGVGLVPDFLCHRLVDEGLLQNPLNISIDTQFAYYLEVPAHKRDSVKLLKVRKYIQSIFT